MKLQILFTLLAIAFLCLLSAIKAKASPVSALASDNASAIYLQNWGGCGCKDSEVSTAVSENAGTIYLQNWGHSSHTIVPIPVVVSDNTSVIYLRNWAHNNGRSCSTCQLSH